MKDTKIKLRFRMCFILNSYLCADLLGIAYENYHKEFGANTGGQV